MFTVASRFRRLKFVGYLSTIEAAGTGSWLSVVQVLLDVSIALLVAIIEFHGGIHRGYRTISSEFFFVKRYMQDHLDRVSSWRKNLRLHWDPPKFFFQVEKSTTPIKKILWRVNKLIFPPKDLDSMVFGPVPAQLRRSASSWVSLSQFQLTEHIKT